MLRAVVLALVAAGVAGEVITIRSAQANPGAHGYSSETVYVVGNEEPSWSRASDFSRFQVVQSSAGEATFSRVYQLRPTSSILGPGLLLRSGFSEWVEGQLDVLSELQALLVEEEGGCGHMAPASTQTALPGMMGYMASTRFGPSFYTTFVQQGGETEEVYGKDANILGNWGQDDRGVADLQTPGVRQRLGQAAPNEVVLVEDPAGSDTYRWLEASGDMGETTGTWERAGADAVVAEQAPVKRAVDFDLQEDGPCIDWGLLLFCTLFGACVAVWCSLFTAWRRLATATCCARPVVGSSLKAHLLSPLPAEKCTGPSVGCVEVAADAVEQGTYHAPVPSGSEFVTIAYVPLKGEA